MLAPRGGRRPSVVRVPRAPRGPRAAALVAILALLLAATACTADDPAPESPSSSQGPSSAEQERTLPKGKVRTSVRVGQVAGTLSRDRRKAVVKDVGRIVDRWFKRSWLDQQPARGRAAFPSFSSGARSLAQGDRPVLTAAKLGRKVDAVVPRTRTAVLDVLAPGGTPAAVTARIRLGLTPYVGTRPQDRVVVTGRLMLTRAANRRWQVVGYDVATALPDKRPDRTKGRGEKAGKKAGKRAGNKGRAKQRSGRTEGKGRG